MIAKRYQSGVVFELRDIERFIAIVRHRNFGRAAAALKMTQPALSRRIAALEEQLGAALFSRARRQIELTPIGELLVREGRAVLAQANAAERALQDAVRGSLGQIRVGTQSLSRFKLLPEALRRLRVTHPSASVTVSSPPIAMQLDLLREGKIDVTLARGPLSVESDVSTERLRSDPIVIALPQSHRFAKRKVVEVRELSEEPFIETAAHDAYRFRDLTREITARAGFTPRVVETADSPEALLICVAAGIGIGFMHDASKELALPDLVYRRLRPAGPSLELQAVWRRGDRNPLTEPFVAALSAAAQSIDSPNAGVTQGA